MKALALWLAIAVAPAYAQGDAPPTVPDNRQYSPYPAQPFPDRVYFGDMHLHTSYSTDAGMIGNTLEPEQPYRYAHGETVTSQHGTEGQVVQSCRARWPA